MTALSNGEELFYNINLKAMFAVFDLIISMNELIEVSGSINHTQLKQHVYNNCTEGITFEYFKEIMII